MAVEQIQLADSDFEYVRNLAKDHAAIVLEADKRYLVETRMSRVANEEGFASIAALVHALRRHNACSRLHVKAIDALTTNETLFFRDRYPFDALVKSIFPALIEARRSQRRLRIWSAASSTGQEAYSIAMLIREHFPELASWNVSIVGTDISETVLQRARSGCYAQHEVNRGLPPAILSRYFKSLPDCKWEIKPEIRNMVQFLSMNLVAPWLELGIFDVIFIRNVLIYFDTATKKNILNKVKRQLAPDGYLALGSAETPVMITQAFQPVNFERAVFYRIASAP